MGLDWPFVGREREVETILRLLDEHFAVAISGRPGVGKTRAATAIGALRGDEGDAVRWIYGAPGTQSMKLAPFTAMLGNQGAPHADAMEAVVVELSGQPSSRPPLLIAEDVQYFDDASIGVLHQLIATQRAQVVMTLGPRYSPRPSLQRMLALDNIGIVELGELGPDVCVELLHQALGAHVDSSSASRLIRESAGIPLGLRELVEGSLDTGALSQVAAMWTLRATPRVSVRFANVVESRLAELTPSQRELLELLALGEGIELELLQRIATPGDLEHLEHNNWIVLLVDVPSNPCQLVEPAVGLVLTQGLGPLAQLRRYRQLWEAIEQVQSEQTAPADQIRHAVWALRAGVEVEIERQLDAAKLAIDLGEVALAAELASSANLDQPSARAALMTSWCWAELGDHEGARRVLATTAKLVEDPWDRAALVLRYSEEIWWSLGECAHALSVLEDHLAHSPTEADALIEAQIALFGVLDGEVGASVQAAQRLVEHDHIWVRFVASIALTTSLSYLGQPQRALATAQAAVMDAGSSTHELLGDPNIHVLNQIEPMIHNGQISEALELAGLCHSVTANMSALPPKGWSAMHVGNSNLHAGNLSLAAAGFAESEAIWCDAGIDGLARWASSGLVIAYAGCGESDFAAAAFERCASYYQFGFGLNEAMFLLASAWVSVGKSELGTAQRALDEGIEIAAQQETLVNVAHLGHDAARLGLREPAQRALEVLGEKAHGPLADARIAGTRALLERDPVALEAAAEVFVDVGALMLAAESLTFASQRCAKAGRTREAERIGGRAHSVRQQIEAFSTPLVMNSPSVGSLTKREHAVAKLAATGATNRQIAQELFVSERTVESHLYRIYNKLGVTSRAELANHVTA